MTDIIHSSWPGITGAGDGMAYFMPRNSLRACGYDAARGVDLWVKAWIDLDVLARRLAPGGSIAFYVDSYWVAMHETRADDFLDELLTSRRPKNPIHRSLFLLVLDRCPAYHGYRFFPRPQEHPRRVRVIDRIVADD